METAKTDRNEIVLGEEGRPFRINNKCFLLGCFLIPENRVIAVAICTKCRKQTRPDGDPPEKGFADHSCGCEAGVEWVDRIHGRKIIFENIEFID